MTGRTIFMSALLAAMPLVGLAATATVTGTDNIPNAEFAMLSSAVNYVQATDDGPHTINVTASATPTSDSQIVISEPMTIEGDFNNDGPCDILVDQDTIDNSATANIGPTRKAYIDVQSTGTVIIRNLKIHPNSDSNQSGNPNAVSGIQLCRPANEGDTATYTLEKVFVSGSHPDNAYVDLGTATDLYTSAGVKRWGRNVTGITTPAGGDEPDGDTHGSIVAANTGLGYMTVNIINCHAGLSRSGALQINGAGSTATTSTVAVITGGLFGHSLRDGIHAGAGNKDYTTVTIQGTHTNRVRVLNVPHVTGKDGHAVELDAVSVPKLEYVDTMVMSSGNGFKFENVGAADLVRYVRALGKTDAGINTNIFVAGGFALPNVSKCTFVGSGSNYNPIQVAAGSNAIVNITDSIFTSENLGVIQADNPDNLDGLQNLTNCAIPNDGDLAESLNTTTQITNGSGTFFPTQTATMLESPTYMLTRAAYDWTESAVSIGGTNPNAGNPNVLRPSNANYATAATSGLALVGGAGPGTASVKDWSLYETPQN